MYSKNPQKKLTNATIEALIGSAKHPIPYSHSMANNTNESLEEDISYSGNDVWKTTAKEPSNPFSIQNDKKQTNELFKLIGLNQNQRRVQLGSSQSRSPVLTHHMSNINPSTQKRASTLNRVSPLGMKRADTKTEKYLVKSKYDYKGGNLYEKTVIDGMFGGVQPSNVNKMHKLQELREMIKPSNIRSKAKDPEYQQKVRSLFQDIRVPQGGHDSDLNGDYASRKVLQEENQKRQYMSQYSPKKNSGGAKDSNKKKQNKEEVIYTGVQHLRNLRDTYLEVSGGIRKQCDVRLFKEEGKENIDDDMMVLSPDSIVESMKKRFDIPALGMNYGKDRHSVSARRDKHVR